MSRTDVLRQMEVDTMAFVFNSIVPNSRATYNSAQKAFFRWCAILGSDSTLTLIPPEWFSLGPHSHPFRVAALAGFLGYLVNDNAGKPTSASSAINYLSAARKHLEDSGIDVAFMTNNPVLKATRTGLTKEWKAVPGHSTSDTTTLMVTADMLCTAKNTLLDVVNDLTHLAVYSCSVVSYCLVCRTSEIMFCPATSHHLVTEKVEFIILPVGSHHNGSMPARYTLVDATQTHKYPISRVAGHFITVIDSKNDQFGTGNRYPHIRKTTPSGTPSQALFDLTDVLYTWAFKAHPVIGQPFLSSPSTGLVLTRKHMTAWYHQIASLYDLDPSRVNTHSTRFAGASALLAAGFSIEVVIAMGRWSPQSKAFLRYLRLSISTHLEISKALCDQSTLSFADVQLLHPAMHSRRNLAENR